MRRMWRHVQPKNFVTFVSSSEIKVHYSVNQQTEAVTVQLSLHTQWALHHQNWGLNFYKLKLKKWINIRKPSKSFSAESAGTVKHDVSKKKKGSWKDCWGSAWPWPSAHLQFKGRWKLLSGSHQNHDLRSSEYPQSRAPLCVRNSDCSWTSYGVCRVLKCCRMKICSHVNRICFCFFSEQWCQSDWKENEN